MADQIYFEDVGEGDLLPEITERPTTTQLVHWAAAVGDFYPVHYDKDFAVGTGVPTVLVHGPFKHALLGRLVSSWAGPQATVKRVSCSFRGQDYPNQNLTVKGRVTGTRSENDENLVELEIWSENESGERTTPGSAIVALPSRPYAQP